MIILLVHTGVTYQLILALASQLRKGPYVVKTLYERDKALRMFADTMLAQGRRPFLAAVATRAVGKSRFLDECNVTTAIAVLHELQAQDQLASKREDYQACIDCLKAVKSRHLKISVTFNADTTLPNATEQHLLLSGGCTHEVIARIIFEYVPCFIGWYFMH